jgi:hypothetical protein
LISALESISKNWQITFSQKSAWFFGYCKKQVLFLQTIFHSAICSPGYKLPDKDFPTHPVSPLHLNII